MAYRDLSEKRTRQATGKERSGVHGTPIDGIAAAVTPSTKHTIRKSTPEAMLRPQPGFNSNPFALNPQLKGFLQAKAGEPDEHLPVRPGRFKRRGPVIE